MGILRNIDQVSPTSGAGVKLPLIDGGGQRFDVRYFGALGNGSADDTPAIQDAIDAAYDVGGGIVEIVHTGNPYLLDDATALIVRPGVTVRSSGGRAILRRAAEPSSPLAIFTHDPVNGSSGAVVEGLRLRGPTEGTPVAASGNAYGVWIRDGAGVTVRGLDVEGFTSDGIRVDGNATTTDPSKVRISNNWVRNCYRGIFAIHKTQDLILAENFVEEVGFAAIVVDDLSGSGSYGPPPERVIIHSNICRDWARVGSTSAILVSAAGGATITGNFLEGVGNAGEIGLVVATGGNVTVGIQEATGPAISGNVFKNIRGVSLALQGVRGASVGVNTYINPGLDSGGSGSVAVQLARSLAPDDPGDDSTERNCSNCKIMGQVIVYENGVTDELATGIDVSDAAQTDNELLFNTVLAGTTRIDDGGTNTLKVGNKVTDSATPRFKMDGSAELTGYLHIRRSAAQIYYDRANGAADQYQGITWRQLDASESPVAEQANFWYDYTNDRWLFRDNANAEIVSIYRDGRVEIHMPGIGIVAESPDGTRYRLAPPNGGGAASWVAA